MKLRPLRGNNKIDSLFKNGLSSHSPSLILKFQLDDNSLFKEFCVSVSKKKIPRAVDRNKIKRRTREVLRKNKEVVYKNGGGWYMFIFSSQKILTFSEIEEDLLSLFN